MKHIAIALTACLSLCFSAAAGTTEYWESFDSLPDGALPSAAWLSGGNTITSGAGVSGSKGLSNGGSVSMWKTHAFNWNDSQLQSVVIGMDFQASSSGTFDDDRCAFSYVLNNSDSSVNFGGQVDTANDNGLATFWRTTTNDRVQVSTGALSGIVANGWYRYRVSITKLTPTSATMDYSLIALDGNGNPTGVPFVGSVPNTATFASGAPKASYFADTVYPSYKNFSPNTGACDNAYFAITTVPEPATLSLLGLAALGLLRRR